MDQIASDRALQQQQQRERIRCNASDRKSDRGFNIPNCEQSVVAHSKHNYRLTNNKVTHFKLNTLNLI